MKYKDEDWLREAYKNNSIQEMADMIDCSTASIHKYMNEYGIERPSKHTAKGGPHTDEDWLREKYKIERLSQGEIADICDVSKGTIKYWLDKHGIESRGRSEAAKVRMENHPELAERLKTAGTEALKEHGSNPKDSMSEEEFEAFKQRLSDNRQGKNNPMYGRTGSDHPSWVEDKAPHRFYSSKKWEETREEVLTRDNHKCQACGREENLHVHHIIPISAGGDRFNVNNLVTLCNTHHNEWEGLYLRPDNRGES